MQTESFALAIALALPIFAQNPLQAASAAKLFFRTRFGDIVILKQLTASD